LTAYITKRRPRTPRSSEPGSQAQLFEVSSDSDISASGGEPRRSGRTKKASRTIQSQQEQIELGLIPAPGANGRAMVLNAKKKRMQKFYLGNEFDLV
jgi:hypothetical protein